MIMKQKGFTIIELAVTMAVLALIMFSAVPSIGTWMDNTRIRNAADSMQSGLQLARSEAVRRNTRVSFWLVSAADANKLGNDCKLSDTSASWVVSVDSPEDKCGAGPSITDSPKIVNGRPAGDGGGSVIVSAKHVQNGEETVANSVTFDGFGRIVNSDAISRISVNGSHTGAQYRALRLSISSAGMVRMCDPQATATGDPRKCGVEG
jgi:type IV fimbrial biogenesis protein FimT